MYRVMLHLRAAVAAIALSGVGWGQSAQPTLSASGDPFADWRASANDAADRALAAAVSDRPWMEDAKPAISNNHQPVAVDSLGRLRTGIERVQRLRPVVEPILQQGGVPPQLSAMVLVESGGQPTIMSPKGARGVWQFMPDTARRYGLAVDAGHDDRTDVVKSTRAASRYLRDLYAMFGDWSLALAAYNAGEQAVTDAIHKAKSRDFGSISSRGFLPLETRNYVPAVMAAMNPLHYVAGQLVGTQSKGIRVVFALSGAGE